MNKSVSKAISIFLCLCFLSQQAGFAQVAVELNLATHLSGLRGSLTIDKFRPLHLRYLSYDSLNNSFKLLLDKGTEQKSQGEALKSSTHELLNYFFIGTSLPNDSFWVNLRPDSPDNVIDPYLAQTDVGKILLEADLQLKKDTSLATSPQTAEGKAYWDKLYRKAEEIFGIESITIPTLTRPWIVPGEIIIRESTDNAYIYKATLKVMLEQDYLGQGKGINAGIDYSFKDERLKKLNEYSSGLIRETIIPKLTKEINTSKKYAALRQVYFSLILAQWFKQKFYGKAGLYSHLIDQRNLDNLASKQPWDKQAYFKAYQISFSKGEYNLKEPVYTPQGQVIRSYMSGGIALTGIAGSASSVITQRTGGLPGDFRKKMLEGVRDPDGEIRFVRNAIPPGQEDIGVSPAIPGDEFSASPIEVKQGGKESIIVGTGKDRLVTYKVATCSAVAVSGVDGEGRTHLTLAHVLQRKGEPPERSHAELVNTVRELKNKGVNNIQAVVLIDPSILSGVRFPALEEINREIDPLGAEVIALLKRKGSELGNKAAAKDLYQAEVEVTKDGVSIFHKSIFGETVKEPFIPWSKPVGSPEIDVDELKELLSSAVAVGVNQPKSFSGDTIALKALLQVCIAVIARNKDTGKVVFSHFLPSLPESYRPKNNAPEKDFIQAKERYLESQLKGIDRQGWQITVISSKVDNEWAKELGGLYPVSLVSIQDIKNRLNIAEEDISEGRVIIDREEAEKDVLVDNTGRVFIINLETKKIRRLDLAGGSRSAASPAGLSSVTIGDSLEGEKIQGNQNMPASVFTRLRNWAKKISVVFISGLIILANTAEARVSNALLANPARAAKVVEIIKDKVNPAMDAAFRKAGSTYRSLGYDISANDLKALMITESDGVDRESEAGARTVMQLTRGGIKALNDTISLLEEKIRQGEKLSDRDQRNYELIVAFGFAGKRILFDDIIKKGNELNQIMAGSLLYGLDYIYFSDFELIKRTRYQFVKKKSPKLNYKGVVILPFSPNQAAAGSYNTSRLRIMQAYKNGPLWFVNFWDNAKERPKGNLPAGVHGQTVRQMVHFLRNSKIVSMHNPKDGPARTINVALAILLDNKTAKKIPDQKALKVKAKTGTQVVKKISGKANSRLAGPPVDAKRPKIIKSSLELKRASSAIQPTDASPINYFDPDEARARDLLEKDPRAWIVYMDMLKLSLRNDLDGSEIADIFIADGIRIAKAVLEKKGIGYRLGDRSDEVAMVLPGTLQPQEVKEILGDIQRQIQKEYRNYYIARLPDGLAEIIKDADIRGVRGAQITSRENRGGEAEYITTLFFEKDSADTGGGPTLKRILRESGLSIEREPDLPADLVQIEEARPPYLPAGAVRLEREGSFEDKFRNSLKKAGIFQREAKKSNQLVWVEELNNIPDVKEGARLDDSAYSKINEYIAAFEESCRSLREFVKTRYGDNEARLIQLDNSYAAFMRRNLYQILQYAIEKAATADSFIFAVRGPPDNFYIISYAKGKWQATALRQNIMTLEEGLDRSFRSIISDSKRGLRVEGKYPFKVINDFEELGSDFGNQLIKLDNVNLLDAFNSRLAEASEKDGVLSESAINEALSDASRNINNLLSDSGFSFYVDFEAVSVTSDEIVGQEGITSAEQAEVALGILETLNAARKTVDMPENSVKFYSEYKDRWPEIEREIGVIAAKKAVNAARGLDEVYNTINMPGDSAASPLSPYAGGFEKFTRVNENINNKNFDEELGEYAPYIKKFKNVLEALSDAQIFRREVSTDFQTDRYPHDCQPLCADALRILRASGFNARIVRIKIDPEKAPDTKIINHFFVAVTIANEDFIIDMAPDQFAPLGDNKFDKLGVAVLPMKIVNENPQRFWMYKESVSKYPLILADEQLRDYQEETKLGLQKLFGALSKSTADKGLAGSFQTAIDTLDSIEHGQWRDKGYNQYLKVVWHDITHAGNNCVVGLNAWQSLIKSGGIARYNVPFEAGMLLALAFIYHDVGYYKKGLFGAIKVDHEQRSKEFVRKYGAGLGLVPGPGLVRERAIALISLMISATQASVQPWYWNEAQALIEKKLNGEATIEDMESLGQLLEAAGSENFANGQLDIDINNPDDLRLLLGVVLGAKIIASLDIYDTRKNAVAFIANLWREFAEDRDNIIKYLETNGITAADLEEFKIQKRSFEEQVKKEIGVPEALKDRAMLSVNIEGEVIKRLSGAIGKKLGLDNIKTEEAVKTLAIAKAIVEIAKISVSDTAVQQIKGTAGFYQSYADGRVAELGIWDFIPEEAGKGFANNKESIKTDEGIARALPGKGPSSSPIEVKNIPLPAEAIEGIKTVTLGNLKKHPGEYYSEEASANLLIFLKAMGVPEGSVVLNIGYGGNPVNVLNERGGQVYRVVNIDTQEPFKIKEGFEISPVDFFSIDPGSLGQVGIETRPDVVLFYNMWTYMTIYSPYRQKDPLVNFGLYFAKAKELLAPGGHVLFVDFMPPEGKKTQAVIPEVADKLKQNYAGSITIFENKEDGEIAMAVRIGENPADLSAGEGAASSAIKQEPWYQRKIGAAELAGYKEKFLTAMDDLDDPGIDALNAWGIIEQICGKGATEWAGLEETTGLYPWEYLENAMFSLHYYSDKQRNDMTGNYGEYYNKAAKEPVRALLRQMLEQEIIRGDALDYAVRFFIDFAKEQPFHEANHRTANFMMNYILMKHGLPIFVLTPENSAEYERLTETEKLQDRDLSEEDIKGIIAFFRAETGSPGGRSNIRLPKSDSRPAFQAASSAVDRSAASPIPDKIDKAVGKLNNTLINVNGSVFVFQVEKSKSRYDTRIVLRKAISKDEIGYFEIDTEFSIVDGGFRGGFIKITDKEYEKRGLAKLILRKLKDVFPPGQVLVSEVGHKESLEAFKNDFFINRIPIVKLFQSSGWDLTDYGYYDSNGEHHARDFGEVMQSDERNEELGSVIVKFKPKVMQPLLPGFFASSSIIGQIETVLERYLSDVRQERKAQGLPVQKWVSIDELLATLMKEPGLSGLTEKEIVSAINKMNLDEDINRRYLVSPDMGGGNMLIREKQRNKDEKVSSPVTDDAKGGIDLRALPIMAQPIKPGMISLQTPGYLEARALIPLAELRNEWQKIENMLSAGLIPSSDRIKEYLQSCCQKRDFSQEIDKVLSCIADILRQEEERVGGTDPGLKEVLVLLESDRPANEMQLALAKITIEPKEPKTIEQ